MKNRVLIKSLLILPTICLCLNLFASDSIYYECWDLSNLDKIGGHTVQVFGNPEIIQTELGKAIYFDGTEDRILIDFNPILDAREFTIEVIFKPDACYPKNTAPRFVHFQDPEDPEEKRVMIELRINKDNMCYMDGFINTDSERLALIDKNLIHKTEKWQHVAITYKKGTLTNYFNGIKEKYGKLGYNQTIINATGKTSLGGRMNHAAFYSGFMKTIKISHKCLSPENFLKITP